MEKTMPITSDILMYAKHNESLLVEGQPASWD